MIVKGLKTARRFFNSGKYKEVIRLLEPVIFQYRESFNFFYLLGVSCLYAGELGGALSYLKRAEQLKEYNINTQLALAVVYLKKTDKENALRTWLRVLEIEPKNKIAQKGLNVIRKYPEPEDCIAFCDSQKIYALYPKIKKKLLPKVLFFITIVVFVTISTVTLIVYFPQLFKKSNRPGIEKYTLPEKMGLIDYSKTYKFTFSEKEIDAIFNKAKSLFNNYKDNFVLVEINRLLNSNASMDVKSIMYAMKDHLQTPDFSMLKKADSFTYTEVITTPYLYEDCFIRWEGKVGGLQISDTKISFDFWVGNTKEFFGVVPVILNFGETLTNGESIEVLGKIQVNPDDTIIIEGIGIHKIVQD